MIPMGTNWTPGIIPRICLNPVKPLRELAFSLGVKQSGYDVIMGQTKFPVPIEGLPIIVPLVPKTFHGVYTNSLDEPMRSTLVGRAITMSNANHVNVSYQWVHASNFIEIQ